MKNSPSLTEHKSNKLLKQDMARYHAIVSEIEAWQTQLAPSLREVIITFWKRTVAGDFSQIAALLPYWLNDLAPVPDDVCHQLGLAHLYGWYYYYVQDELLDGDLASVNLLSGHLALLKMVEIYSALGLRDSPCWAEFETLNRLSAESYALEISTRFASLAQLTPARLAPWTVELIINRASPFYFNTLAQLYLAGISPEQALHSDLLNALKAFTAARQISDDASDWIEDLQQGRLNYVSARLMGEMYSDGLVASGQGLDLERLIGHQLHNEVFWREIEETAQFLCQEALNSLTPYGSSRLAQLIERQQAKNETLWANLRRQRAAIREIFTPAKNQG